MDDRISWDEYFMGVAELTAKRSTCVVRKVGAVLVVHHRIIATGYNGAPSGIPHCVDIGCRKRELGFTGGTGSHVCAGTHAEQNAIIQCAVHSVSCVGAILYCTSRPCIICAKMLINSGIVEIVCYDDRVDEYANKVLQDRHIPVRVIQKIKK